MRDLTSRSTATPKAFFEAARAEVGEGFARLSRRRWRSSTASRPRSTKPFDEGRKFERELFVALVEGNESKALRHVFFAERADRQDPRRARGHADARRSSSAAVIGAGTMGGGIAMNFAQRRHPGDDARDEAGGARQRAWRRSARTTRRTVRRAG